MIRNFHVALAYITVVGFVARVAMTLMKSPLRDARWLRIAPHVIDTLLLVFGIWLAVALTISPLEHAWLMAKIVGLIVYIAFGVMAMRAGSRRMKLFGFVGALVSVGYIFAVAYSKRVVPF